MGDFNLLGIYTPADLLHNLQEGMKLCDIKEMRDGTRTLHTVISADADYIRWNCYGSSAISATPENMHFVIETIFATTLASILRRYVIEWG